MVVDLYSGAEQKMNRVDAQSPVQAAQTSQQQQQTQSAAAHQQTFINPATLPPGYNYHYYAGGMLPGGYSFTPTMFPVGNLVRQSFVLSSLMVEKSQ